MRFRELYTECPEGELIQKEPPFPDFILTTDFGKKIGIEITEAVHPGPSRRNSSTRSIFTEKVIEHLKNLLPFPFSINIEFLETGISKSKQDQIIREVAIFCALEYYSLEDSEGYRVYHLDFSEKLTPDIRNELHRMGYRTLPTGIKEIKLSRHDIAKVPWNAQFEGGPTPDLTEAILNGIIFQKNQRKYIDTDCNWLVIVEGNYYSGTFDEICNVEIESKFEKIFILRLHKSFVVVQK